MLVSSSTRPSWTTSLRRSLTARWRVASCKVTTSWLSGLALLADTSRSERLTSARCWWCVRAAGRSAYRSGRRVMSWRPLAPSRTCSCVCGAAPPPKGSTRCARYRRWTPRSLPMSAPMTTVLRCFLSKMFTTWPVCLTWSPAETWTPAQPPSVRCRMPETWSQSRREFTCCWSPPPSNERNHTWHCCCCCRSACWDLWAEPEAAGSHWKEVTLLRLILTAGRHARGYVFIICRRWMRFESEHMIMF